MWWRISRDVCQVPSHTHGATLQARCRNDLLSKRLLQDADAIADAWYTGNKWPRVKVSYTKLFLPAVHFAIALCFTGEYMFGQMSLAGLQSAARSTADRVGAPVAALVGQGTMQRTMNFVAVQLPDVLQEYTFYLILVPVFAAMLVRCLHSRWLYAMQM